MVTNLPKELSLYADWIGVGRIASGGHFMPQFDPELIQLMRSVLDDVMSSVPLEISGTTAKAYLAEAILKAAAQGHTSYTELMAAATDQIQTVLSILT